MINKVDEKIEDGEKCSKTKSIIEFDPSLTCSITSLAVKKNNKIKPTTRFFSGKMLMFAKVLLESFVYDLTETFFFPNTQTKETYNYHIIERIFPYSILTDTSSIGLV